MLFLPGEKENNKKACLMILQKVVDDPQSGSCPNVSYADVAGPVANYNPTGSPYAVPTAEVKEVTSRTRSYVVTDPSLRGPRTPLHASHSAHYTRLP